MSVFFPDAGRVLLLPGVLIGFVTGVCEFLPAGLLTVVLVTLPELPPRLVLLASDLVETSPLLVLVVTVSVLVSDFTPTVSFEAGPETAVVFAPGRFASVPAFEALFVVEVCSVVVFVPFEGPLAVDD